jgi:septum formation protein
MLASLSGTRHAVVTGVAVRRARDGAEASAWERTWVTMRAILPAEVEDYVRSGEWEGKAGGYAIQETADRFVVRLEEGGFDNVVGLPVRLALELLDRLGGLEQESEGREL